MVKSCLTVRVERPVTNESDWRQLGGLASGILQTVMEKRESIARMKAVVARDPAGALHSAEGGIWVQLNLPLPAPQRRPSSRVHDARRAPSL
jgi:hypothetical protein